MPAVPFKPDDAGPENKNLTSADIWCLIDYVRSLRNGIELVDENVGVEQRFHHSPRIFS